PIHPLSLHDALPISAEPRLLKHSGPAVVFADYNDMAARIDDPALDVTADSVLVLKNAGPLGAPGMPEWGQLPIPKKILAQGVREDRKSTRLNSSHVA